MQTYVLQSEKRDASLKAKKIRREGLVPAVVYGQHIEPMSIQIKEANVIKFLHEHSTGAKVMLKINGDEQLAVIKEYQREPITHKVYHIGFQALTSGEKVKVTIPVHILNKEQLQQDAVVQEQLSEIEISTLPEFLIDHVDIDISQYELGDSVYVGDLDVVKDKNIEVLSPEDAQVCIITQAARFVEETVEDEEEAVVEEVETVSTEE